MPNASAIVFSACRGCLAVSLLALVQSSSSAGEYDDIHYAANYCANFHDPIKLSEDRMILCLDSQIFHNLELDDHFKKLNDRGFAVIRSPGGFPAPAMKIADILFERNATVVVRDYCLSACANYIFVATRKTYVLKNALVAWHGGPSSAGCEEYLPGDRIARGSSRDTACSDLARQEVFFRERGIQSGFIYNPPTPYTRMMFNILQSPGNRSSTGPTPGNTSKILWTWNPINYQDSLKDRIVYEKYPSSQYDLDQIISRLQFGIQIIYDPGI